MLKTGILNPSINCLLSRVRHTNTLVIADRGFPFWPQLETADITLTDDIPTVLMVLRAVLPNFQIGAAFMAEEFRISNTAAVCSQFKEALAPVRTTYEPHGQFKQRVPHAIGLIRTADTTQYANIILESA